MVFIETMAAVFIVSIISLIGVLFFFIKEKLIDKLLFIFVSFATGALLSAAFLDLIPEAIKIIDVTLAMSLVLVGMLIFFITERFLYFYHCHERKCKIHTFTYMSLIGDAIHNFVDGAIIAASFIANVPLGIVTTISVIFHEIPQELGDYSILLYGGFSKKKALAYNFLIALTAFAGALAVFFVSGFVANITPYLVAIGAGGFIYLAGTDLLPKLHEEKKPSSSLVQFACMIAGAGIIYLVIALL